MLERVLNTPLISLYFLVFTIPENFFPVDTGHKLNVHKTFRRRAGRLLNVLCTFNLRPASTGLLVGEKNQLSTNPS